MATISCPNCGLQNPSGQRFCSCNYPLYLEEPGNQDPPASDNPAVLPGDTNPPAPGRDITAPLSIEPSLNSSPSHQATTITVNCPDGHVNQQVAGQQLCAVCGKDLYGPPPPLQSPPPTEPPAEPIWGKVLVGALAAALVVGGLSWFLLRSDDGEENEVLPDTPAEVEVVSRSLITAMASSVLDDDGDITYSPANTLDGDSQTAWNSKDAGDGTNQTLTFTFSQPIELSQIDIINGYAKDAERFRKNHRIARMRITTDETEFEIGLADVMDVQTIEHDGTGAALGTTRSVTILILDTYRGDLWENGLTTDLAVSEVTFHRYVR